MTSHRNYPNRIDDFISTQVISRGLDGRTAKAYRMDLEKFYVWLEDEAGAGDEVSATWDERAEAGDNQHVRTHVRAVRNMPLIGGVPGQTEFQGMPEAGQNMEKQPDAEGVSEIRPGLEDQMETYLEYLSDEKGLRHSTLYRKQRVFGYYLAYLVSQGDLGQYHPLQPVSQPQKTTVDTLLTKREVEAFFQAIDREYEDLDSDFRRRVCLRDQVMMELLFYHGLEASELLRLELSDYNPKTYALTIRRKREKDRTVYLFSRALQRQMNQWLSEHIYFEHGGVYHNRMFLSKLGKPLSMKMVINIFDKYRMMAGIEKVCKPKDLKNSLGRYAEELVREQG